MDDLGCLEFITLFLPPFFLAESSKNKKARGEQYGDKYTHLLLQRSLNTFKYRNILQNADRELIEVINYKKEWYSSLQSSKTKRRKRKEGGVEGLVPAPRGWSNETGAISSHRQLFGTERRRGCWRAVRQLILQFGMEWEIHRDNLLWCPTHPRDRMKVLWKAAQLE